MKIQSGADYDNRSYDGSGKGFGLLYVALGVLTDRKGIVKKTSQADPNNVLLDFDGDGNLVGIEVLGVSVVTKEA